MDDSELDELPLGNDAESEAETGTGSGTVSDILRSEREKQDISRKEMSSRTKISERHLIAIDNGDFSVMPSRTYIIGFVRSYARELGLDAPKLVQQLRDEMGMADRQKVDRSLEHLEPGDPARNPSSKLAWIVGGALIVLVVLVLIGWRGLFMPAADLPPLEEDEIVAEAPVTEAPADTGAVNPDVPADQVTFTATVDGIWVKFYDRYGRQLYQKQMALGESFTIPDDADGPQLWTGRPDALTVTIGGREVAPLADGETVIRDVPVDAASLRARPAGPGTPG